MTLQATNSTAYLPSYARPTAASKRRWASNISEIGTPETSSRFTERETTPSRQSDSLTLNFLRHYGHTLSPLVWRSKAPWLGPFRFLDLPGELRNRVYEYAAADQASRYMKLYHSGRPVRLPPLLAASRRLCIEAGSYYFNNDYCRLIIYGSRITTLLHWLNAIGRANREGVANNKNVQLSFSFSPDDFTHEEHNVLITSTWVRVISLSDAAHIVGLGRDFDNLAEKHPAMHTWQLQSRERYRSQSFIDDFREREFDYAAALDSMTPIPQSFINWLRPVLRQIFEMLNGDTVAVRDLRDRRPYLWSWSSPSLRTLVARSGRKLYIDANG